MEDARTGDWHSLTDTAKEAGMPRTILNLTISSVAAVNIPPQSQNLGDMRVQTDDITAINGDKNLTGQHSGFCFLVRQPNTWLCRAGYPLPGIPQSPVRTGGQIEARGILDFSSSQPGVVAITGGTGDYQRASGEVRFLSNTNWQLTIFTP
jgi:hypothetical protein